MKNYLRRFPLLTVIATLLLSAAGCSSSGGKAVVSLMPSERGHGIYCCDTTLAHAVESLPEIREWRIKPCVNNVLGIEMWNVEDYPSGITLFRLEGDALTLLGGGYDQVGFMNEERIPVVPRGDCPVILDADMNEVFRADEVEGVQVKSVASMYSEGLLWFQLTNRRAGCYDRDGKVAFLLEDSGFNPVGSTHYFVDGEVHVYFRDRYVIINRKGEMSDEPEAVEMDEEELKEMGKRRPTEEEIVAEAAESAIKDCRPFDVAPMLTYYENSYAASSTARTIVEKKMKVSLYPDYKR